MQALTVAALSLIGVLIGAALQYTFGQRLEAGKQLNSQKAQAYIDFIRSAALSGQSRSPDILASAADAKTRICLYGSVTVIHRLSDFERAGARAASADGQTAIIALLHAMREDVTNKASPQREDLSLILFGQRD